MTPRRLDPAVVTRRLQLIETTLDDLASVGALDEQRLRDDPVVRAAVERFIQVIVDLACEVNGHVVSARTGRPPVSCRGSFADMADLGVLETELAERLAPSAGMRNLLVHQDVSIDVAAVAHAAGLALVEYRAYCRAVGRALA